MAHLIVVTERLGSPRWGLGFAQRKRVYPIDPTTPSATCHLLPGVEQPALCGYEWESLIEVPGARSFEDVPLELRCDGCEEGAGESGSRAGADTA